MPETESFGTDVLSGEDATLTVGDLADRTGVAAGTLRMWEQRHGFPVPTRLESGHRRYRESDVEAVRRVAHARDRGVRLERAVAEVRARAPIGESLYSMLRKRHANLTSHRMRKGTLEALSHAIEDEFCATDDRSRLFGGFQSSAFYEGAAHRWEEFSRLAGSVVVFAEPQEGWRPSSDRVVHVPLPEGSHARREWFLVCESSTLPVALAAWELPGQVGVPDRDRSFEVTWTLDPATVTDAVRVCQEIARLNGVEIDGPPARAGRRRRRLVGGTVPARHVLRRRPGPAGHQEVGSGRPSVKPAADWTPIRARSCSSPRVAAPA